jgi:hypothetical protein
VDKKVSRIDAEQKKMVETVKTAEKLARYCKEKVG